MKKIMLIWNSAKSISETRQSISLFVIPTLLIVLCIETINCQATDNLHTLQESKLKLEKLEREIEKLQAEIRSIQIDNQSVGPKTKWFSSVFGAIGGLAAALIGLLIWILGRSLTEKISLTQEAKLEQDKELSREKHNIELFQNLANDNPRIQLSSASVLLQRLYDFQAKEEREMISEAEKRERPTILQVLIAVTKEKETQPAILKLIGDNLVKSLGAVVPDNEEPNFNKPSSLKGIDFQKVRLTNVWWKRVDAREIDFFEAVLDNSGLSEAFLMKTVFLGTSLKYCVLRNAQLQEADLRKSNVIGANLQGANLNNAKLEGCIFDSTTQWPNDFDPLAFGAVKVSNPG